MRSVPEWIGKTDDTPIPPRVKLRVFERYGGICYLSGRKIRAGDKWDCEHVQAIVNGGANRESNLKPALRDGHRIKSDADLAEKSKTYRMAAKNAGVWPKGQKIRGRNSFQKRYQGET